MSQIMNIVVVLKDRAVTDLGYCCGVDRQGCHRSWILLWCWQTGMLQIFDIVVVLTDRNVTGHGYCCGIDRQGCHRSLILLCC